MKLKFQNSIQKKNGFFQVAWLLCAVFLAATLHPWAALADTISYNSDGELSTDVTLPLSRTYSVSGDYTWTLSGTLSGGGTDLTKTGTGNLVLSGANIFSSPIVLKGGTLTAANSQNVGFALGNAALTPGDAANTITYNAAAGVTATLRFSESSPMVSNRQIVAARSTSIMEVVDNKSVVITSVFAGNGGAVLVNGNGELSILGILGSVTFSDNSASGHGGAVLVNSSGKLSVLGGIGDIGDVTFSRNSATGTANSFGGAIYNSGTLVTDRVTFSSNTSNTRGGAIYSSGTSELTATKFRENTANIGGAIYVNSGSFTFDSCEFTDNFTQNAVTGSYGGAIYIASTVSGAIYGENTTFTRNKSESTGSNARYGGAIYNMGTGSFTLVESEFIKNEAKSGGSTSGGAIYSTAPLTGTNLLFQENSAKAGGAYNSTGTAGTDDLRNTTFTGNKIVEGGTAGGAINTTRGLYGENLTFTENTAQSTGGAISTSGSGSVIELNITNFIGNKAVTRGGAIYMVGLNSKLSVGLNSELPLQTNIFQGNQTTGANSYGGAIANWQGLLDVKNATFTQNTSYLGGAIYSGFSGNSGSTELAMVVFTENTANTSGGAVFNYGRVTGENLEFTGNTSTSFGGAIFNSALGGPGELTLTDGSFTGNTAPSGGAIMTTGQGNVTLDKVIFTGNIATAGGAIYLDFGTLNIRAITGDSSFSGNSAAGVANAIYIANSSASPATLNLAAGEGNTLEFLDPVTSKASAAAGDVNINPDAENTGTVLFSGEDYDAGSADVKSNVKANTTVSYGTMELAGNAVYGFDAVSGSFTLGGDATLAISSASAQLLAGNNYAQNAGAVLALDLDGRTATPLPNVRAATAGIVAGANLVVTNLPDYDIDGITKASDLAAMCYTFLQTTGGITGEYAAANVSINGGGLDSDFDYIIGGAFKSASNLDYNLGYSLAWFAGQGNGHGTFTIATGETFEIDSLNGLYHDQPGVGLTDQTAYVPFASDWDGKSLTKLGDGTLVLSSENTFSGGLNILAGAVHVSQGASLGTGTVAIDAATLCATGTFSAANVFSLDDALSVIQVDAGQTMTLTGTMTGTGVLNKTGDGTLVNLGGFTGTVNIAAGTLEIGTATFGNVLTGSGTFAVNLASAASDFTFDATVGDAFTGAVVMRQGNLVLNDNAETVFAAAALQLDADGTVTIADQRTIQTLTINGGGLKFTVNPISPTGVLTVTDLNITGEGGAIMVDLTADIDTSVPMGQNLYDYYNDPSTTQQKIVDAANVTGDGTQLEGVDFNGVPLGNSQTREIVEGPTQTGVATFGSMMSVTDDGIYLGYGLTQVEAVDGQNVTLDSTTAVSDDAKINAKLTGSGGFIFSGTTDVSVGNAASDYTGQTLLTGESRVTMMAGNAFGSTSGMTLADGVTLDMNGMAQTVGALASSGTDTEIILGNLAVNQSADTTYAGVLSGGGTLAKGGVGTLTLAGEATYTGATSITGGTLALVGNVSLANSSGVVANGTFDVSGISAGATSIKALSGTGAVAVGAKALTFGSSNADTEFSGVFSSDAAGGLTKTGTGTFTISGNSLATFAGTFTQASGNVHLAGSLGGTYTQAAGTALTSTDGAALGVSTFRGTVTPTGTLNVASALFDGATVNLSGNLGTNNIAATGAIQFAATGTTLILGNLNSNATADYLLMTGSAVTGMENTVTSVTLGVNQRGGLYLAGSNTALYYGLLNGSTTLTWEGTDAARTWDNNVSANTNWQASQGFNTYFKNGDAVLFNDAAANKNVIVAATGVTSGGMTISAGDYTFRGGAVNVTGDFLASGTANATFNNELNVVGNVRVSDGAAVDVTGQFHVGGVLAGEAGSTSGRLNIRGGASSTNIQNLGETGSTLDTHFYIDSSVRGVGSLNVAGMANMDNATLTPTVWGWAQLASDEYTLMNNTSARTGTTTVVNNTLTAYDVVEGDNRIYLKFDESKLTHRWGDPAGKYIFTGGSEQGMIKIENGSTENILVSFMYMNDPSLAGLLVNYLNAGLGDTSLKFGVYSDSVLILEGDYLLGWSGIFAWDLTDFNITNHYCPNKSIKR